MRECASVRACVRARTVYHVLCCVRVRVLCARREGMIDKTHKINPGGGVAARWRGGAVLAGAVCAVCDGCARAGFGGVVSAGILAPENVGSLRSVMTGIFECQNLTRTYTKLVPTKKPKPDNQAQKSRASLMSGF